MSFYNESFRIAGDLNLFLTLSRSGLCRVRSSSVILVNIAAGGISGRLHSLRIREVLTAYRVEFSVLCLVPFFSRYLQRLLSLYGLP